MLILAIDPGSEQSAWLMYDCEVNAPATFDDELYGGIDKNTDVLETILACQGPHSPEHLAIENIRLYPRRGGADEQSSGVYVGNTTRDTLIWIGRFIQAWDGPYTLIDRQQEYRWLLGKPTGTDPEIYHALLDLYGGSRQKAVGTKKNPGPLYGIKNDLWSALAVAVTWARENEETKDGV